MIVAIDTNCLVRWSSRKPDDIDRARFEHLLTLVAAAGGRIVIPAPSFAEFLVKTDSATNEWLDGVTSKRSIVVAPFDRRAALECALLDRAAIGAGDKRGGRTEPWQRIKVDRQILAIARVANATLLVTDDDGVRSAALSVGISVKRVAELEVPQSALQRPLQFTVEESNGPAPDRARPQVADGAAQPRGSVAPVAMGGLPGGPTSPASVPAAAPAAAVRPRGGQAGGHEGDRPKR